MRIGQCLNWSYFSAREVLFPVATVLGFAIFSFLIGCSESGTSPDNPSYSVQGTLQVEDQDSSAAVVRLFAAPQDPLLQQTQADYPALGFAPVIPMLFNPLSQQPLDSLYPAVDGSFKFEGLSNGSYIIDAKLSGYGCPQPVMVILPGNSSIGILRLVVQQPIIGTLNNTTWDSGRAYLISGDVQVEPNAKLVIQEGVLVEVAGDFTLTVLGGLQIDGFPTNPVRFRSTDDYSQTGGDWGGLYLYHPQLTCVLNGASFQGTSMPLHAFGGNIQVQECLFEAPGFSGVNFSAGATGWVRQCIIRDGVQGLIADYCNPAFDYNIILRSTSRGVTFKDTCYTDFRHNALMDCDTGIWTDWFTQPVIEYNLLSGGSYALDAQRQFYATIKYNEIRQQSRQAIYLHGVTCYPVMQYNNFLAMPDTIFLFVGAGGAQTDTIDAAYNYWDGKDRNGIIESIIINGSVENPLALVRYDPFLVEPVPGAGP